MLRPKALAPLAALCALALSPAAHADLWKDKGGDCDETAFQKPAETDLKVVAKCVRLFEAYHNADFTKKERYKGRVIAAMKRLYEKGSDVDAHVAWVGLKRLSLPIEPRKREGVSDTASTSTGPSVSAEPKKKSRLDVDRYSTCPKGKKPETASKRDIKRAKKYLKRGLKDYKKEKYKDALAEFEKMLDVAPGYHSSLYNVATMSAVTGDKKRALDLLQCLRDIGGDDDIRMVKKARKDEDFRALHDNDDFKLLTGYAKILLLDSLPEGRGEDNVDNLKLQLEKLGYPIYAVKEDNNEKTEPHIWFRWSNRVQAYLFSKVIDHPRTDIKPMPEVLAKRGYDIVISWGDRYEKDKDPPLRIADPEESGKKLDDLSKTEDDIMRSPDKFDRKIDESVGEATKPVDTAGKKLDDAGKTVDKVEDLSNKPGETVDKVKDVGDKLKSPF